MRRSAPFALPLALFAATAHAQTQPACIPPAWRADASGTHVGWAATESPEGTVVSFCVENTQTTPPASRCFRHTLASGAFASLPPRSEASALALPTHISPSGDGIQSCWRQSICSEISVGHRVVATPLNASASRLLAVGPDGARLRADWFSYPRARRGASFSVPVQSAEASRIEFAGDTPVLFDCVGAGPGCTASLLRENGTILAPVGGGGLNFYTSSPVSLSAERFAIADTAGAALVLQNARTGAVERRVTAATSDNPDRGVRLLLAHDALVLVYGGARAGEVDTYDVATLTRRGHHAPPPCSP
jgi:hypothetical protein